MAMDGAFFGAVGPIPWSGTANNGGRLTITVVATDAQGASSTLAGLPVTVFSCPPPVD
jgi:putative peptide zinc metalloprotease protein